MHIPAQGPGECRVGGLADSEHSYLHCVPSSALHKKILSVSALHYTEPGLEALALHCREQQLSPPSHPNCLVCSRPLHCKHCTKTCSCSNITFAHCKCIMHTMQSMCALYYNMNCINCFESRAGSAAQIYKLFASSCIMRAHNTPYFLGINIMLNICKY